MRLLTLIAALFCAVSVSATTLTHTLQTGHKTSTMTGHSYQSGDIHSVEVVTTGDADTFAIGCGQGCWVVDNEASGGSIQTTTTRTHSDTQSALASGSAADYCNTSIAVGALYSAQNKEQGSGYANAVTDTSYTGSYRRDLMEYGSSGNGGSESGSYELTETERGNYGGSSNTITAEVFDYTILTSIVE